uniref:Sterile alpha motif domain-containing protein 5 n=1 Tax=Cacopsylla melanoneura TaxID=428564 RepID=A0A8D9EPI0_9HEMI
MAATMSNKNIVVEWLKSLHLGQYAESFIDNGYDDLEICKQIGDPDLDAIGVLNANHRNRLLASIKTLREEGAASVYFTLEESQIIQENCKCDNDSKSSSEKLESPSGSGRSRRSNSTTSLAGAGEFADDYEEGKAQLIRIPKLQLKMLIRDKLLQDKIKLSAQPYSTQDGERGYLEGLASRYADLFNTHYRDVLVHLEDLRKREWAELSPRIKILGAPQLGTPTSPPGPAPNSPNRAFPNSHLPTSQSQPIYVPGKYSPSSCLSDREEDEIYGFSGYGVYGKQMVQRQQQQAKLVVSSSNNYHSCLSPRSAYFYEFPPNERANKKKTTFSRFLKTLKSSKHKDKNNPGSVSNNNSSNHTNHNSPKHSTVNSRINTPDSLREPQTIYPPIDCDRLRAGPGRPSNFEETINRLKIQDALEKKQRFDREHEEILRDIRTGLLHLNRAGGVGPVTSDDTYMYDDEMLRHYGPHWYDEPPYESDPEDFLMVGQEQPNGRVCYTLSNRPESALHHRPRGLRPPLNGGEGSVISLRSAGDISLPHSARHSVHQRGLLLPHTGLIIPLRGNNRESGDYAASDVQSICSRLSSVSMETSRSDQIDTELYHRLRCCNGGDNMASPGHSSDYADEDLITLNSSCSGSTPLTARPRVGGGAGGGEKYRRHHPNDRRYYQNRKHQSGGRAPRSNSSAESLPSTCSTQVLLEDRKLASTMNEGNTSVVMTRAVALVDNTNSPYDKEALKFKKGDIINVISMCTSGSWRGYLAHDEHKRVGTFKFINVQLVPLETSGVGNHHYSRKYPHAVGTSNHHSNPISQSGTGATHKHRPKTLEQLLRTIDMEEHMSVFVLNGYEDLESFCEIKEEDLNYLKIINPEHRAKILAAVQVMHEYESPEEDESSLDGDDSSFSGKHARNNLDSEHSTDDTRSTNTTSTTIVSNNSSLLNHNGKGVQDGGGGVGEVSDTVVTCGDKIQVIKYVPGEVECESGNPGSNPGSRTNTSYCGFSEKSSDSGVSSSSVSSAHNAKQLPLPVRRCNGNGLPMGATPTSTPGPGGSKVALIERSNRSYVGHFIRKTQHNVGTTHSVQLND